MGIDPTDPNGRFSVKEILTEMVLPRLDRIEAKLELKADSKQVYELETDLAKVEGRVGKMEARNPEQVIGEFRDLQSQVAELHRAKVATDITHEERERYEERLRNLKRWLIGVGIAVGGLGSGVAFNAFNLYGPGS